MKIGAQFYTLRDMASTKEGLAEALARVADIGYTTVQISGTCGYEPQWMDEQLKKNGLACVLQPQLAAVMGSGLHHSKRPLLCLYI